MTQDDGKTSKVQPPTRFVGLHAHSTLSIGDAIGLPQEHIDFALQNGMDGLALTDHGTMAGVSHQQIHQKKLNKAGRAFKAIPGIEAYFIDSLQRWRELRAEAAELKAREKVEAEQAKLLKKTKSKKGAKLTALYRADDAGGELQSMSLTDLVESASDVDSSPATLTSDTSGGVGGDDELGGTIVEQEEETKQNNTRFNNPLYQRNHLVLLPKNNAGLKSLFRLTSESYIDGMFRVPRMDFDMLRKHANNNLVASSACVGGYLAKIVFSHQNQSIPWDAWIPNTTNYEQIQRELKEAAERFVDVLGGNPENFYLELQFNKLGPQDLVNYHLIELSKRTGLKLIATADSHYASPDVWKEREVYKAMAWSTTKKQPFDASKLPKTVDDLKCELYPKNAQQMWDEYMAVKARHPEYANIYDDQVVKDAIERTHDIAHQLIGSLAVDNRVKLPAVSTLVPKNDLDNLLERLGASSTEQVDEDEVAFKHLVKLGIDGLRWRKKNTDDEYVQRLRHELDTIKHLKLSKYFLTYYNIMKITSDHMLIGNGRGSAAGSLLSYVLGITQVDPIRFGLLFARFLSKKKAGMADIDSDFSDRDKAAKLLTTFFGEENVVPVSLFAQLQLKSLIKDVSRLHNLPFDEINSSTGKIEGEVLAVKKQEDGFDRATWDLTFEEAMLYSPTFQELMEKHPEFETTLKVLFKQMRTVGRHAGGVIITDNSREAMPMITSKGELQTPWPEGVNYRHLEEFGLLKFDILGLGTLRMFENCTRRILQKQGVKNPTFNQIKEWFWQNLHPDNNPMDDINVYKHVFWEGNYHSVFQFINDQTQGFMKKMKPTSILDIAVATSIFRPGPLSAKVDRMFLKNRTNPELVTYKHPFLREVFKETEGLLIFQEQLQMVYHKLAGVPLEDTDAIRKAFTKKDKSNTEKAAKDREALKNTFLKLCKENNNVPEAVSSELFDEMEKLVAYSFNKSHAVCYAITSWQCAWFLTYHPDEWIATSIDYCTTSKGKVTGKEDPKVVALAEAKTLGYTFAKPDINISELEFIVDPNRPKTLVPSFASLQGIGKAAFSEIQQFRPYNTVESLVVHEDGKTWKHSKFNSKALSTLIKMESLDSMNIIGPDKPLKNYRQLHDLLIPNLDLLKRTSARKNNNNVAKLISELLPTVQDLPDWTREEKIEFAKDISGTVDMELVISKTMMENLQSYGFKSIDDYTEKDNYWAVLASATVAKAKKTGKPYLRAKLLGPSNKEHTLMVWNWKGTLELKPYDVVVGLFEHSEKFGGFSCFQNKLFSIKEK